MLRSRRSFRESGDARSEAACGVAPGGRRLAHPARCLPIAGPGKVGSPAPGDAACRCAASCPPISLGDLLSPLWLLASACLVASGGLVINRKRTYRLYCEQGLQVRTRRRKRLLRPRTPMPLPDRPNQRWSMDFVSNQLASGRRFRVLNILDGFSRECVGQWWTRLSRDVAWPGSSTRSRTIAHCRSRLSAITDRS